VSCGLGALDALESSLSSAINSRKIEIEIEKREAHLGLRSGEVLERYEGSCHRTVPRAHICALLWLVICDNM
jgi:hypothetical protein